MNINPINFKGVSIGHNLAQKLENQKKSPKGFYQVANFLNGQNNFDFEIKNTKGKNAEISAYMQATRENLGTLNTSIKDFEKNPSKVVKNLAKMIWGNNRTCQRVWHEKFEHSPKSDDGLDYSIGFCDDSKVSKVRIKIKND